MFMLAFDEKEINVILSSFFTLWGMEFVNSNSHTVCSGSFFQTLHTC